MPVKIQLNLSGDPSKIERITGPHELNYKIKRIDKDTVLVQVNITLDELVEMFHGLEKTKEDVEHPASPQ